MGKSTKLLRLVGISLLIVFILFFVLGSLEKPLSFEIKKAEISKLYFSPSKTKSKNYEKVVSSDTSQLKNPNDSSSVKKVKKNDFTPVYTPDSVDRVLLIGDSQLEGLRQPVSSYCENNDHVLVSTIIWYGSSTKQWATTDTLEYYLDLYKPTVVIFAIGLNELFVRDLELRSGYIKSIKKTFEEYGVRYSWVGPAAWTADKGIIDVMSKEVGDHFFPSHTIKMERAGDGRHPSKKAAKLWFDQVAESITKRGVINFSTKVDTLTRLKYKKTILLTLKK
jgi:hypothetical protein